MKRYFFRDILRGFRSIDSIRYGIAVARKFGGVTPRVCNLCGYSGLFKAHGHPPRYDARCPGCGSRERQRLFALLLSSRPDLGAGDVVHFAPEAELQPLLKAKATHYLSADPFMPGCDLELDLMELGLEDASVDVFVANHVLEHVVEDSVALSELYRCLRPGGVALVSVPIAEGWGATYEDVEIALHGSDEDREIHFGRHDHVRYYGRDFVARLVHAGFDVETFFAGGRETALHNLIPGDRIFIARKAGKSKPWHV